MFSEYGENAKILAQSTEAAGDRVQTELSNLKDNVGDILRPIGAEFQKVFGQIIKIINNAITAFKEFMGIGLDNAIAKVEANIESLQTRIENTKLMIF